MSKKEKFSAGKFFLEKTIYWGLGAEVVGMRDWLTANAAKSGSGNVIAMQRLMTQCGVRYDGRLYLPEDHIERFADLVRYRSNKAGDLTDEDKELLVSLYDGKPPVLNGLQIARIRDEQLFGGEGE
jgi:hypothetical protein